MQALELPVTAARYVDGSRAEALARLGIGTVEGLLRHYPHRYLDLTNTSPLADARLGADMTVVGRVHDIKVKHPRPKLTVTEVAIVDGTGALVGTWFNQPYAAKRFAIGERVAFAGRVDMSFDLPTIKNPFVEKLAADQSEGHEGRVLPVHPATEGLTTNWLRRLIASALEDFGDVPDHLPASLRVKHGLVSLRTALRDIHFPDDMSAANAARRRLAYDELLTVQLGMALRRHVLTEDVAGTAHDTSGEALRSLTASLPFALTSDQQSAVAAILDDMARPHPMNRMLLGDVGTGKTIVAAHALCAAADTGAQAAMMAPTEVLAQQYALKIGPLLDSASVPWALLTSSTPRAERATILEALTSGAVAVVFGTHALLERDIRFRRLTLAIVDEQHRFGVNQRLGLRGKGTGVDLLVMTATPIPRSLALTLYGDLDTTYLRQRPAGDGTARTTTTLAGDSRRQEAYDLIRESVAEGRQAIVVCPLVDVSPAAEAKAAAREFERLRDRVFPGLEVGLLTGRLGPAEKADVMQRFRAGRIDVLVATTVIEVGVDVPNATIMIIENAERFGLAQLHQLRGRVGRGEHPGRLILFAEPRTESGRERMQALLETNDGFELAERDLRLRGEGQVLGERQHGLPELRLASIIHDAGLLDLARADATDLLRAHPHLATETAAPLRAHTRRAFADSWEWVSAG